MSRLHVKTIFVYDVDFEAEEVCVAYSFQLYWRNMEVQVAEMLPGWFVYVCCGHEYESVADVAVDELGGRYGQVVIGLPDVFFEGGYCIANGRRRGASDAGSEGLLIYFSED